MKMNIRGSTLSADPGYERYIRRGRRLARQLGQAAAARRREQGFTQIEWARKRGLTRQTVGKYERGEWSDGQLFALGQVSLNESLAASVRYWRAELERAREGDED